MVRLLMFILSFSVFAVSASADILFEGYSKVISEDKHIGWVVSRYEFDSKRNHFISTYYTKIGSGKNESSESLKAVSDSELNPISYEYTQVIGTDTKTIDAKFKGQKLTGVISENGKTRKISKTLEKGTFLSTFLVYLMMKSQTGLRADASYEYKAIAEEDGEITSGKATVGKLETFNRIPAYKILNTFKDASFVSYVSERGEVLATQSTSHGVETQLVAKPSDATGGFAVNEKVLKNLFGGVPRGIDNVLSKRTSSGTPDPLIIKKPAAGKTGK